MPRKAKTEETVVTEESTTMENVPAETGYPVDGDFPAEGEPPMDGKTPADGNTMDGELPVTDEAAMDEELPGPAETAMEGDVLEGTSPSGETWRWKQKPEMTAEWNCSRKIQGSLPSKVMGMRLPAQANLPRNAPLRPELELKAAQGKMPLKVQPLPEGGKQGHPLLRQSRKHLPLQGKPPLPASLP